MKIYNEIDLKGYIANDWILRMMDNNESEDEDRIRTNQWMRGIEGK